MSRIMKFLLLLVITYNLITFDVYGSGNEFNLSPKHVEVYNKIKDSGVEFPEIVFVQSVIETGHYTSRVYRERSNLFGFQTKNGVAYYYDDDNESIEKYKEWQDKWIGRYRKVPETRHEYYYFLNHIFPRNRSNTEWARYSVTPDYTNRLEILYLQIFKNK